MRGRLWLNYFIESCTDLEDQSHCEGEEWTRFMGKVMDKVAHKMKCYVARRRSAPKQDEHSGEYLGIDAIFIDEAEYDLLKENDKDWDPFVLPRAAVELENSYGFNKISYCLWKLLCIRSPIRVLICYQEESEAVSASSKHLEDVIWQGGLMRGTDGDLLVIIGNEGVGDDASWGEYYKVFEWRNDGLEKIGGLEW